MSSCYQQAGVVQVGDESAAGEGVGVESEGRSILSCRRMKVWLVLPHRAVLK